jgi:hypothetical protein
MSSPARVVYFHTGVPASAAKDLIFAAEEKDRILSTAVPHLSFAVTALFAPLARQTPLMGVHEEGVPQICLVAVCQFFPHHYLLLLAHSLQSLLILLVEAIVAVSKHKADADLSTETSHDGDLARFVSWCLALLEGLRTLFRALVSLMNYEARACERTYQDIAHAETHQGQRIGGYLF